MADTTPNPVSWTTVADGIVRISLCRPPANALGTPIIEGLGAALDAIEAAGDVHVVLVTSAVPGFFAAGADIKHMAAADGAAFAEYGDALRGVLDRIASADRVSIAVVEGLALGGGMELAMACTLRIASASAQFGLPEVKLGLIPGAGGTQRLPRLVGRGRALDIMLAARSVGAEEAHAIGLVDRLVADGAAEQEALDVAAGLRKLSLPAQQAVIRSVDAAFDLPTAEGFAFEVAQVQHVFEQGEAKEGITAFLEKRPPNFA